METSYAVYVGVEYCYHGSTFLHTVIAASRRALRQPCALHDDAPNNFRSHTRTYIHPYYYRPLRHITIDSIGVRYLLPLLSQLRVTPTILYLRTCISSLHWHSRKHRKKKGIYSIRPYVHITLFTLFCPVLIIVRVIRTRQGTLHRCVCSTPPWTQRKRTL